MDKVCRTLVNYEGNVFVRNVVMSQDGLGKDRQGCAGIQWRGEYRGI